MKKTLLLLAFGTCLSATSQTHNALHFDGVDDYVSSTTGAITGSNARTVEAWILTDANCNPSASGKQKVVVDMGATGIGTRYTLNLLWSNSVRIEVGGGGLSGTTAINDSTWHHIAAVYNPNANNKHSLYIDGVLEAAGNFTQAVSTSSGGIYVGRRVDGVNNFDGLIDEVRIWNTALTGAEIAANYEKELCNYPTTLKTYYNFNHAVAGANNLSYNTLFDQSGTHNGTLQNFAQSGNTSNWVLGQNLSAADSLTITDTLCLGMWSPDGSTYWDTSGTYVAVLENAAGCDSVLTYELEINSVDTAVSITLSSPASFVAAAQNATYQWINCADSSEITGSTQMSYTPTANGSYAVVVTQNGCSAQSACYDVNDIGVDETELFGLYPNPTSGDLHLPAQWVGQPARVYNAAGAVVLYQERAVAVLHLEHLPAGLYTVRVAGNVASVVKH